MKIMGMMVETIQQIPDIHVIIPQIIQVVFKKIGRNCLFSSILVTKGIVICITLLNHEITGLDDGLFRLLSKYFSNKPAKSSDLVI